MREVGRLHVRIRAEETAQEGVVEAGVHVDEAEPGEVLVAGEAAAQEEFRLAAWGINLQGGRVAETAPWVVTVFGDQCSICCGNVGYAAQIVPADVVCRPTAAILPLVHHRGGIGVPAEIQSLLRSACS